MFIFYAFFLPRIDFRDALPCDRWVMFPGKKSFLVGDLDQRSESNFNSNFN